MNFLNVGFVESIQHIDFFFIELPNHSAWRTNDQAVRWNLFSVRYECVGSNQTVFADSGIVQYDGVDSDQTAFFHGAAMKNGFVSYGHFFADAEWAAGVGVKNAAVLNVGSISNCDSFIVSTNDGAKPDSDISA